MWTLRTIAVGLTALSAGCGGARSVTESPAPKTAVAAQANESQRQVEIDNQNFSDMNIYLIQSGTRMLLGSATGLSKSTLPIPTGMLGGDWKVTLVADPIGGSVPIRTPTLLVAPGQNVYWTIGANPAESFASAG